MASATNITMAGGGEILGLPASPSAGGAAHVHGNSDLATATDDRSSWLIGPGATKVVPAGRYICTGSGSTLKFEIRSNAGAWNGDAAGSWGGGTIISDGVNFQIKNISGTATTVVFCRKLSD